MADILKTARSGVVAVGVGVLTSIAADAVFSVVETKALRGTFNNAGMVGAAGLHFLAGAAVAGAAVYGGEQVLNYISGDDFFTNALFFPVVVVSSRSVQSSAGALRMLVSKLADMGGQARNVNTPGPTINREPPASATSNQVQPSVSYGSKFAAKIGNSSCGGLCFK